ncbi:MAG: efflux RND transporter periplasmic adaptor subunit [Chitinophagales bacterium]|nr:efflux RND transporter periplasmic adaptor subunit [Chitinophagales bacterium]
MSRITRIILISIASLFLFFTIKKIIAPDPAISNVPQKKGGGPILAEYKIITDTSLTYKLQTTGSIRANEQVDIVSELPGKITKIYFKEGSTVKRGALLFKLDDASLQAQKKKLEVSASLPLENERRIKVLLDKGGTSQQEYDEALNNLQTIQSDLELIKVQLEKTEIRAPFSGKVGLRNVSEGAYVSANTILTSLQDINKIKIDFSLPEKYAAIIRMDQKILFIVENDTQQFTATIAATEPAVDPSTRALMVRAISGNGEGKLIPGTSTTISIDLNESDSTIMVPTSALIPQSTGFSAYIIREGKAVARVIKTGYRDENNVQVLHGLDRGDTLITTNILMLRPQVEVRPVLKK